MDLSPARFDRAAEARPISAETAMLLAGIGARQAASATARAQAALSAAADGIRDPLFAPVDGAFNGGVARGLVARRDRPGPGREGQ